MKLEDMRKIAEQRTKNFGYWHRSELTDHKLQGANAEFAALAANTFDALLDVAETAKYIASLATNKQEREWMAGLEIALKKLEEI